ncbi:MAG TPA: ACP S-malonyltransferase [Acidimicrobiales bacterium]|nr:ACP S-malonyltransferase [Acidimicrobiales bacterium]
MDAVMFPGQGSQRPGMGEPWASAPSWSVVEQVSDVLGRDVGALLLDADAATLQATRNAQVASFALGLVILGAARAAGHAWGAAAGHSLGEYTALVAAGVLDIDAATRLVGARADAMQAAADASPGTMAAVLGLESDAVQASCDAAGGEAWIANDNAPGQIVIAGTHDGIARASAAAKAAGGKVMPLAVGGAFHTPLMGAAQAGLDAALAATAFTDGACPVVANVDAAPHAAGAEWPALLSAQLCRPVRWREGTGTLVGLGVTRVVELGPGGVLTGLAKRTAPSLERLSLASPGDLG